LEIDDVVLDIDTTTFTGLDILIVDIEEQLMTIALVISSAQERICLEFIQVK